MVTSVCLITPGHIGSTPRLVKEADALVDAGFSVRVVAVDHYAPVRRLDATVLSRARWRCERIGLGHSAVRFARRAVQALARRAFLAPGRPSPRVTLWAHHPHAFALAAVAAREPADLYLGHCLAGLAAAGIAATRHRAKLGFDAEDFHRYETSDTPAPQVVALEEHWVPRCQHRTAASPLIAKAYASACHVPTPTVILNVFPIAEAPPCPARSSHSDGHATLYWFSQTIGPGRGLEELVRALGRLGQVAQLHLRGSVTPAFRGELEAVAVASGCASALHWHESAPPSAMVSLAAPYDVGLSLERNTPRNRALCLTNKIFTSILAGVPVLMSDTPAQRALATDLGDAARVGPLGAPDVLAAALRELLDPDALASARATAWRLGRERYNWDREQATLISTVQATLEAPPPAAS